VRTAVALAAAVAWALGPSLALACCPSDTITLSRGVAAQAVSTHHASSTQSSHHHGAEQSSTHDHHPCAGEGCDYDCCVAAASLSVATGVQAFDQVPTGATVVASAAVVVFPPLERSAVAPIVWKAPPPGVVSSSVLRL